MRTNADDIRVDACMIHAATGAPIWADHCDARRSDLFAFETEVAARFSRMLELELVERASRGSVDRSVRERPGPRDQRLRRAQSSAIDGKSRGGARLLRPGTKHG